MTAPALYESVVTHTRHGDIPRTFRHRLYTWLVDLDELPELPPWLRPFARFDARDHLGAHGEPIRRNLDAWLAAQGEPNVGRVLMLAHARVLGHVFNPITVYWCHRPDGQQACVVAEVSNTYGETHRYLLHPDAEGTAETDKRFYVSPFLPGHGRYRLRLPAPSERLALRVELHGTDGVLLTATLSGRRAAGSLRQLTRMLARRPLVPHQVSALIRAHGIALWLRRVPRFARAAHPREESP